MEPEGRWVGIGELEIDQLFALSESHVETIEESGLAKNGNHTRRIAEASIERKRHFTGKVNLHVGEDCGDVSVADTAVAIFLLVLERKAELRGDLKREYAIVSARVDQSQEIDESVFMKQTDSNSGTQ